MATDRIRIKDLMVRCIVGINPEERVNRQDVVINIEMVADLRAAVASDDIADAVNYRTISKRVIEHVENSSYYLIERMAGTIADFILDDFAVDEVRVAIEKPGALRFARSVGVEVVRGRDDRA